MSLSNKIFIAVFVTSIALGTALLWGALRYVNRQSDETFSSHYAVFSNVLGDTLTRLDANMESLMLNAAKVVKEQDAAHGGALGTDVLTKLRSQLSVTHIFVLDHLGNFIRSTNEDPKLIPNAFSFCPDYKNLYSKVDGVEATPVIHPMPEPKPFKFLYIPTYDRKRLLNIGVRVDFVAQTLTEALKADSNLISLALFSPVGQPLGRFKAKDVDYPEEAHALPDKFPVTVANDDSLSIYTKVASSHPKCCQCDVSKTSKDGEYYYILESKVSKKELAAMQAASRNIFLILMLINLLVAFALSRLIARRLVRNIESAVARVRKIKDSGNFDGRIELRGRDEVSFLTSEFDRLLDSLKNSQDKVLEADRARLKMQLARDVAHNIRSPILKAEGVLPYLKEVPEKFRQILCESVREIKALSERLNRQSDAIQTADASLEEIRLGDFLEKMIEGKQVEYTSRPDVRISLKTTKDFSGATVYADPVEFQAVLSNLINNAVESYEDKSGEVSLKFDTSESECTVEISDKGKGIPELVLKVIGREEVTFGKPSGKGVGLYHAHRKVSEWGGRISIESRSRLGTSVKMTLPRTRASMCDRQV